MDSDTQTGHSVNATSDATPPENCRLVRYVAAGEVAVKAEDDGDAGEAFAELIAEADEEMAKQLIEGAHFELTGVVPASEAEFE